jgi:hypothetical protein
MRRFFVYFLMTFLFLNLSAQKFQKIYESMTFEDKLWVIKNHDKVLRAVDISKSVMKTMDSLDKVNFLGGNKEGGIFDAFRHIYWMYNLSSEVGEKCARKVGEIYEGYGEYIFKTTEMSGYDSVGRQMDLFNNELGINLAKQSIKKRLVFSEIRKIIKLGKAKIVKKNQNGEDLDINGEIIPTEEWKKLWNNRRVLVNSNEI